MNIKDALKEFSKFEPMVARDLLGKVREEVIQVDLLKLAPRVERGLRKAIQEAFECGKEVDKVDTPIGLLGDDCVEIFIKELQK